jgi:cytochrome c553
MKTLLLILLTLALAARAETPMEQEVRRQFDALRADLANRAQFAKVAGETFHRAALIHDSDRDAADVVLRRTAALLADLTPRADLTALAPELATLNARNLATPVEQAEARYALYAEACALRRRIAFRNPLLDFDKLVFIKRSRALYDHMCDQFYGMAARPGGGLFVLENPFGTEPRVRDLLADSVVENGRLKGRKLTGGTHPPPALCYDGEGNLLGPDHDGGTFLSPEVSYDGKTLLFAYVEGRGDKLHRHHTDPSRGHWDEGRCYHIFKANADGTGLVQLTDGTWNDFDPCWLPNGRIAFISERRGGYLRCGRTCPNYTLYDMAADGSDITCLSFHETNEWQPSVTNDGRILYTRWDYVDRHGCTAHQPWITTLDGRDSRAVHGNFAPKKSRPDMELDCRAVPGSHKFIATAAPHHGQAFGSLVLIDPQVPDDDGMGPVKRLTPEVAFPESQGGAQVYGTPWPLSENYQLCAYDAAMQPGFGTQGKKHVPGGYGLYLVDAFGNKELLYRDPEIACQSPFPLRARPMPEAAPELTKRGPGTDPATRAKLPAGGGEPQATVAVLDVYNSQKDWPPNTKISALRVLQVLPMTVPSGKPPHETALRIASAGDSVVTVRQVLGTAPVEADGSAHFTVPANKEIFFQALDENGLAVQSMRSATYAQAGERLTCVGCHERRDHTPPAPKAAPLALQRAPSKLQPEVDGANPFSFPRLVQPVLDRQCVACHAENAATEPNLAREPLTRGWYASYANLVERFAFHDYRDGYRTTPGQFGARASRLYELLQKDHHGAKLSAEDLHRIALWLDCTSQFYGVYEAEGGRAQLRGEIVQPTLE